MAARAGLNAAIGGSGRGWGAENEGRCRVASRDMLGLGKSMDMLPHVRLSLSLSGTIHT